ncbi:NAD(P)H-dependent oxidoreductase [Phycicoccus sp. BSK3Z-2]|uniref:NAD(P)H-dependent oxidoreductase n=1 Tax=Phycicoccus avicenniae TaxID=2828860 RepID=A0A941D965_9MICO|nr:NAD(P)H-dependent oxidoreductase [Phycicoccus avicenniae]MBR7744223.1 NAD(P)H-dependent oxidoreductase [Phycicoccus avicenniae]
MNVLVLVGSLRAGSTNRRLADAAVAHLPAGVDATVFEHLAELPHYSEELDHDDVLPSVARDLREAVADADALLLVTPEYNGSMPSALKNAVDWASRPRGASAVSGVPAAVLGASGSPRAAQWAREEGVKVLRVAGADVLDDTVGVGAAFQAFEDGRLSDTALDAALRDLVTRLATHASRRHEAA